MYNLNVAVLVNGKVISFKSLSLEDNETEIININELSDYLFKHNSLDNER